MSMCRQPREPRKPPISAKATEPKPRSPETPKLPKIPKPPEAPKPTLDELVALYQPLLDTVAWGAVCCAGMLENALQTRATFMKIFRDVPAQVANYAKAPTAKRYLLTDANLSSTEAYLTAMVVATQTMRSNLAIFNDQINRLDGIYKVICAASPLAGFRVIRTTSKQLREHAEPDKRDLWTYVLRAWEVINAAAVRTARFHAPCNDESAHTWKHVGTDGEEATIDIETTFAVAASADNPKK